MTPSAYHLAYHEGRHCLMAWHHGFHTNSVKISEKYANGLTSVEMPNQRLNAEDCWALMLVFMAGPADDPPWMPMSGTDISEADKWFKKWSQKSGNLVPLRMMAQDIAMECRAILYDHKAKVRRIAHALLERNTLVSSDIERLFCSNGKSSKPSAVKSQPNVSPSQRCSDPIGMHCNETPPEAVVTTGRGRLCKACFELTSQPFSYGDKRLVRSRQAKQRQTKEFSKLEDLKEWHRNVRRLYQVAPVRYFYS